jgi:replicative DNA helicase
VSDMYDHDMESVVLSCLSNVSAANVNKAKLLLDQTKLVKEDFHLPANQVLFDAVVKALTAGSPADPFAVKTQLNGSEGLAAAGGWERITTILLDPIHSDPAVMTTCAKGLRDLNIRRLVLTEIHNAKSLLLDRKRDPINVLSSLTGKFAGMSLHTGDIRTLRDHAGEVAEHLDKVQEGKVEPIIPTGIGALDKVIGGLQPTLILVGALPGVGKSALASTLVQNLAKRGKRAGIISLEDDATWLAWRLLSAESDVNQFHLRYKKLDEKQYQKTTSGFEKVYSYADNVLVVDGSEGGMAIDAVIQACSDMVVNHKADVLIVDHLGEISGGGDEARYDMEVSRNLSRLRGIANRYGVPVVVMAHFRRREGLGPGDKPKLSDFANSSGAERKARIALGLCREPDSETMTIHVLKNTNGVAGREVEVKFKGAAAMIASVEGLP